MEEAAATTAEVVAADATKFDLESAIRELREAYTILPTKAIRGLQAHRDVAIPRLIRLIEEETAALQRGEDVEESGALFAMLLLWEFRAREALPAIVEAVTLPGDDFDTLFGWDTLELLPRVFCVLAKQPAEFLTEFASRRDLDAGLRSSALRGFEYLVREGAVSRDEAGERIATFLRDGMKEPEGDPEFIGLVICVLLDLGAHREYELICEAFEREVVDESIVSIDSVDALYDAESADEELARYQTWLGPTALADTVEELSTWYCFDRPAVSEPWDRDEDWDDDSAEMRAYSTMFSRMWRELAGEEPPLAIDIPPEDAPYDPPARLVSNKPNTRPNEPCPCGSGKKFKKCCGRE